MHRDASLQDSQEMKYLELFIKESHRLIAPVGLIGRCAKGPIELCISY